MAHLSHDETKKLIQVVLIGPGDTARRRLSISLGAVGRSEGEFYDSIVKHGPGMRLTTDEWFQLLSRLPNRLLRSQLDLRRLLSEEQLKVLPPVTG